MGTWFDSVEQALRNLGGTRHLPDIYLEVKRLRVRKGQPLGQYQAWVRYELNHNSEGRGRATFVRVRRGFYKLMES